MIRHARRPPLFGRAIKEEFEAFEMGVRNGKVKGEAGAGERSKMLGHASAVQLVRVLLGRPTGKICSGGTMS